MPMIGVHIDHLVSVWIGVDGVRTCVMSSGDSVPKVAIDGVDKEQFAELIPVVAPRIGGSAAERFEEFPLRVVAPKGATDRDAIGL